MFATLKLGQILQKLTGISDEILDAALEKQRESELRIGELLIKSNVISSEQLTQALAEQFELPVMEGNLDEKVQQDLFREMPLPFLKKHELLPFSLKNGYISVGLADPTDLGPLDNLAAMFNAIPEPILCTSRAIKKALNQLQEETASTPESIIDDLSAEDLDRFTLDMDEPENLLDAVDDAPIIKLVNFIFSHAVRDRASDIHIEPYETELKVRYRIDGFLYNRLNPPKNFQSAIVSRIKVMASMDIAEKRLPQDGRIKLRIGEKDIDVRVSIVPTSHGERVALRLLDRTSIMLGLNEIGLDGNEYDSVGKIIKQPYGIILVTGPTGSGKTTSLYAALNNINTEEKNIITVEDPIEYQLQGIGQIQVNSKIGLTFANGLRSILRQDPDVIMVGEIRDHETAEIAIQASLTGHLVFSTLHTNDAASAFTRLMDMGIEPFLVSSSIIAIIAQRLVRVLCHHCRIPISVSSAFFENSGLKRNEYNSNSTIYKPSSCEQCHQTGFLGRTGLYEILTISNTIQQKIMRRSDSNEIKKIAVQEGMKTLKVVGAYKVLHGITSMEEVLRVVSE